MKPGRMDKTTWEHPKWGTAHVYWQWAIVNERRNEWAWLPVAVEFDFFCPLDEAERCTRDLVDLRLAQLRAEVHGVGFSTPPPADGAPKLTEEPLLPDAVLAIHHEVNGKPELVIRRARGSGRKAGTTPPDGPAA